jgi:hypothetical protein
LYVVDPAEANLVLELIFPIIDQVPESITEDRANDRIVALVTLIKAILFLFDIFIVCLSYFLILFFICFF